MNGQENVRLLTLEEVAGVFRLTSEQVEEMVHSGVLPAIDLGEGGGFRILSDDVKNFIVQQREKAVQVAVVNHQKAELETRGLGGLCQWLKSEKQELMNLYRELSSVMDNTARYLYEELNTAQRAGDHSKSRGLQDSLTTIQRRWEQPRRSYSSWVLQSQERWEQSFGQGPPETEGGVSLLISARQIDLLSNLIFDKGAAQLPTKVRQLEAERRVYQNLSRWFEEEISFLHGCYREMDRAVEKTVKVLKSKAKKASKELDFGRSQVLSAAMTNLYYEWEKARCLYNHWLEGQEERWHLFKKEQADRFDQGSP